VTSANAWLCLLAAGLFEIGWPLGFKLSQAGPHRFAFLGMAALSMACSGVFLWFAQKAIPIGTAYAVWTGIGAAGTFLVGVLVFGDGAGTVRVVSFLLIVAGVAGMRLGA
jgi:quaternary ammonium compound-resistance protein SugE